MRSIVSLVLALSTLGACDSDAQRSVGTLVGAAAPRMEDELEAGMHRRVTTAHGPLHMWTPRHYSESGDIVVCVHADAWNDELVKQFAASGLDAMFIAVDPSWASLSEVLGTAQAKAKLALPMGKVIVVGAASIASWMAESQLDRLVVTNAVDSDVARYRDWLEMKRDRQLIFVGGDVAEELHALLPAATVLDQLPELGQAHAARVVSVKKSGDLSVLLQMASDDAGTPVARM